MTTSAGLVEVLKRELRSRGITYARVARELHLSEASVKRMFSRRNFSLKRLDQVCQLANSEFSDIARFLMAARRPDPAFLQSARARRVRAVALLSA